MKWYDTDNGLEYRHDGLILNEDDIWDVVFRLGEGYSIRQISIRLAIPKKAILDIKKKFSQERKHEDR